MRSLKFIKKELKGGRYWTLYLELLLLFPWLVTKDVSIWIIEISSKAQTKLFEPSENGLRTGLLWFDEKD